MDQFRQIGEVLGGLKALMVLQDDIQINQRQCCLLLDIFTLAFTVIAEEIKQNLKLEEKNTKWKPLEEPLRELHRVFKEGEVYVRRCLDQKDWWGKAVSLHQSRDALEFHIHNLFSYFPAVIEAIEIAGEISGLDQEQMQKKRVMLVKKYEKDWNDPKLFQWRYGKQYLVPQEICSRLESAMKEDKWLLVEAIREKKSAGTLTKNEQRLGDLLLKKLNGAEPVSGKLPPSSVLLGSGYYQLRRRLGNGNQFKEVQWLGESFGLRHFFGDIEPLCPEISNLLSLSHPNVLQYLCGFYDEDKKECFLIMDLMSKDLHAHIKENTSSKKRVLFPLPVVVDMLLQIARGMEFLHSRKIYVGDLNPSNVFLKPRKCAEGYFHVKVSGFGLTSVENHASRLSSPDRNVTDNSIWHAPEVMAEQQQQQQPGSASVQKYSDKADVYSFGMICFELLTGKPPFEDAHLQGDQLVKNLRAGERPLFPSLSPKYLVNLTKRCWHTNPSYRPSFSSICRVLRYIKKFLVMNPYDMEPSMQSLPVDCFDLEAGFLKNHPGKPAFGPSSVSQIPFQMFSYKLSEKAKAAAPIRFKNTESVNEAATVGYETASLALDAASGVEVEVEDSIVLAGDEPSFELEMKAAGSDMQSVCNEVPDKIMPSDMMSVQSEPPEKLLLIKKAKGVRIRKTPAKPKPPTQARSPQWSPSGMRTSRDINKSLSTSTMSPIRQRSEVRHTTSAT